MKRPSCTDGWVWSELQRKAFHSLHTWRLQGHFGARSINFDDRDAYDDSARLTLYVLIFILTIIMEI